MLTPGAKLGSYEIVASLGAGGMGEVYRARDPRLDREVAIKILAAQLASDPVALMRFEGEALSVAKLSHTVVYAMRANGSWDLYSQRIGGRNATPVVNDPQRDEGGPAFSPDGSLIAFHKSDAVGG